MDGLAENASKAVVYELGGEAATNLDGVHDAI